jgi:NTP pyrophosphatase (non-canonical NTP hydrolase)
MQIRELQKEIDIWIKSIGVRYFSELTNMALLTEEVGEVSRLIARMYGEQSFKENFDFATQKEMLADELADVIWVVCCLANQTNIDLQEQMRINLDKKTTRDAERHKNNSKLN